MLARIRKSQEAEGFTLIELLVVIIIIGILAAIAIPVFLNQRKKGVDAGIKSDLKQAANEMESYFTDGQIYPTTIDIELTTGNNLSGKLDAAQASAVAYCISGYNAKGSHSTAANQYVYISNAGGLQSGATAAVTCAMTGAAVTVT